MALLSVVSPLLAGVTFTPVAAAALGDKFPNPRGNAFLYVENGSGGAITVTPTAVMTSRPGDVNFPPATFAGSGVSVGAGASKLIGPFPQAFNDADGNVTVTYSAHADVTVKPIQP